MSKWRKCQQLRKKVFKTEILLEVNTGSTVNCPSQETEGTSTPTRTVENVVLTTKGLQDRNIQLLDGTTVENKGKLILTEIFPSVHETWYLKVLIQGVLKMSFQILGADFIFENNK